MKTLVASRTFSGKTLIILDDKIIKNVVEEVVDMLLNSSGRPEWKLSHYYTVSVKIEEQKLKDFLDSQVEGA